MKVLLLFTLVFASLKAQLEVEDHFSQAVQTAEHIEGYRATPVGQFTPIGTGIADLGYVAAYTSFDLSRCRTIFVAAARAISESSISSEKKSSFVAAIQKLDLLFHHFGTSAVRDRSSRRKVNRKENYQVFYILLLYRCVVSHTVKCKMYKFFPDENSIHA